MYQIAIKNNLGEKIELLKADNPEYIKGAKEGCNILLKLLAEEMDLEDGYEVVSYHINNSDHQPTRSYIEENQ